MARYWTFDEFGGGAKELVAASPKILGVIAARAGSKRLPGKNLKQIGGRSLIEWSVRAAQNASSIDKLIVSSDCSAIIAEANRLSVDTPFVRPPALSCDSASSFSVVKHAVLAQPGYDWVLLLQPTSPFRSSNDIDNIVNLMLEKNGLSAVSASRLEDVPDTMFLMAEHLENKSWRNFMVGEKIAPNPTPKVYTINGALYLADINYLLNTEQFFDQNSVIYEMPEDRAIDIDTDEDLARARNYFSKVKDCG